jgi:hypothetical protein
LFVDPAKKEGLGLGERKTSTKREVPHLGLCKHRGERMQITDTPISQAQSRGENF